MAALDTFESLNASLSEKERDAIIEIWKERTADLLAAQSEDARLRLVEAYMEELKEFLHPAK